MVDGISRLKFLLELTVLRNALSNGMKSGASLLRTENTLKRFGGPIGSLSVRRISNFYREGGRKINYITRLGGAPRAINCILVLETS